MTYTEGYEAGREDIALGVTAEEACADSIDNIVMAIEDDGNDDDWTPHQMREWARGYAAAYRDAGAP